MTVSVSRPKSMIKAVVVVAANSAHLRSVALLQVVLDRDTGKSKGFGFVTFQDARDAADAVQDSRGQVLSVLLPPPLLEAVTSLLAGGSNRCCLARALTCTVHLLLEADVVSCSHT